MAISWIGARSAYIVSKSSVSADQVEMDLEVYVGTQTTSRGTNGISQTILADYINQAANINIAHFVLDLIDPNLENDPLATIDQNEAVWVDYRTRDITSGTPGSWSSYTQLAATSGWRNTSWSSTQAFSTDVTLMDGGFVYAPPGEVVMIPIWQPNFVSLQYTDGSNTYSASGGSYSTTDATSSTELIQYFYDDGLHEYTSLIVNGSSQIIIKRIDSRYDPVKLIFINKYGALQELWFFAKSMHQTSVTREQYKRNTRSTAGANQPWKHNYQDFIVQGRDRYVLNSDWVDEDMNETFRQLLVSEKVWMAGGSVIPVNITTADFEFKTSLNDKLINYTIGVDVAYDHINTIV